MNPIVYRRAAASAEEPQRIFLQKNSLCVLCGSAVNYRVLESLLTFFVIVKIKSILTFLLALTDREFLSYA